MKQLIATTSLAALAASWPALAQQAQAPEEGTAGGAVTQSQPTMPPAGAQQAEPPEAGPEIGGEPVATLTGWDYDALYAEGWSVEQLLDGAVVYGAGNEEIGDVENLLFHPEGNIVALIAEIGGFLGIGDRHVAVPWDEVEMTAPAEGVTIPITEENIGDYSLFERNVFFYDESEEDVRPVEQDPAAQGDVFRATDLIGDMAYLTGNERYGYVNDLVVQDGVLRAVVVDAAGYGTPGYYAYPYSPLGFGYGQYGWRYGLGLGAGDVATIETYDYGAMQRGSGEAPQPN